MASPAVEAMLAGGRTFAVAAAGCGKTDLLGRLVADPRSDRQLVLTHTHAGVAAIRKRLAALGVPQEKYKLETIAGWCLRYSVSYPTISGIRGDSEADPDWDAVYPGAEKLCRSSLGRRVIGASYAGALIDEYQDCSLRQHAVVRALSECIPCRGVGDPMQAIFGFRNDPVVSWDIINADFEVIRGVLLEPWRWRREGRNARLGEWLVEARTQLETTNRLVITEDAPVTWVPYSDEGDSPRAWAATCRSVGCPGDESIAAILKWPSSCQELARRLGGHWPVVERFDDPDLLRLGVTLAEADGPTVVAALVKFVADRVTGVGPALAPMVEAIRQGRGTRAFTKHREQAARIQALAEAPTPANALAWLETILMQRGDWWIYRRDCIYQLRSALRECSEADFSSLPDAVALARARARHRGRQLHRLTIGTPLLVKGLEFDHAILLWEPAHLSVQGLYVALTRASRSLTILSRSRTLVPASAQ